MNKNRAPKCKIEIAPREFVALISNLSEEIVDATFPCIQPQRPDVALAAFGRAYAALIRALVSNITKDPIELEDIYRKYSNLLFDTCARSK